MAFVNFSWVIPGRLAGSDMPGSFTGDIAELEEDIRFLSEEGIGLLVSLEKPPDGVGEVCCRLNMGWRYFPVPDFGVPELAGPFSGLIRECLESFTRGVPVCVHCRAGIGRTGLVLACIMGAYLGIEAGKAIAAVRKIRPAIETPEQRRFIALFLESGPKAEGT